MTARILLLGACLAGGTGVALGAFGAHALKNRLAPAMLEVWQTAVLYQLVHALAALVAGLLLWQGAGNPARWAGGLFLLGILLFSGSLYLLALDAPRWLGPVTPVGGLAFLAGWLLLGFAVLRLQ